MLSSIVVSLLALTPFALATPSPSPAPPSSSDNTLVEKRSFGHGIGGIGGRRRIAAARFRANKNKALIAAERENHLESGGDGTTLAAKNYREANFAAANDRKSDTARFNKAKLAALAREAALRKNVRLGGGGIWKRQFDEAGESGGLDI
ncbi:uncharacterized protein JCM6883_004787, partial [Sporobolomyces salmoneus]|uniref:uncharacterized protein n=1 Tax=Sporobolomyces salmoneus TaxID=183962 RepID=UPI0031750750